MANDEQRNSNLKTAYQELCVSYRAIDDFRTKLLGFLPLATSGVGIYILVSEKIPRPPLDRTSLFAIGAFGFFIALGLSCYELYGIKKCHSLIETGQWLEKDLGLYGQFRTRPLGVLGLINEPFAAGVVYPAVLAAWTFLAFVSPPHDGQDWETSDASFRAICVFVVGFGGFLVSLLYTLIRDWQRQPNRGRG